MFTGRLVLDVWRGSEYASVAVLNNVLPILPFEIFFLKCLQLKLIQLLVLWIFKKFFFMNNVISNNKARPHKRQKHNVFEKQFSLF